MSDAGSTTQRRPEQRATALNGRARWLLLLVLGGLSLSGAALWVRERASERSLRPLVSGMQASLERRHQPNKARRLESACEKLDCGCVRSAARIALDADVHRETLALIEKAPCADGAVPGLRAEALARGRDERADRDAKRVLAKSVSDPHALYALALGRFRRNEMAEATRLLHAAIAGGRGAPAHALLGLRYFMVAELDSAKSSFEASHSLDPDDESVIYNLALIAQHQQRYNDAREGYLKVLRIAPAHKDARYNLAVLAHSAGASAEAKHHLAKLHELDPANPAVGKLSKILDVPTTHAAEPPRGAGSD